jgi:hypothetical protein
MTVTLLLAAIFAMGAYLYNLRRNEQARALNSLDTRPITAPVTGPASRVTLYVAHDDPGVVRPQEVSIALPTDDPAQRGREILHALIGEYVQHPSPHEMAAGADVKDVFLVGGDTAVVDTTQAFADGHRSGVLVETLTLVSVVKTLTANVPGVSRVKVLVDGKERETLAGHADLQGFYDAASLEQLLEQQPK